MDTAVGPVCCPVCTLFMREGISLESHLNTHPKDQVIEALVRYCITSPRIAENNSSTTESVPTSQDNSSQHHDQSVLECTPAHIPTTQYPAFGSSHFTAAITYQQFLSSNATAAGAVIPQYVSVPTILATPNPAHADASQPAIMPVLYNPYLMQQQQQQVQFYNSVRTQPAQSPLLRQILPAPVPNPTPLFPVPQHMSLASSCAPVNNCSMSSTSTVLQVSQNTQTNISSSTSSVLHVAQVGSPVSENVSSSPVAQEQNSNNSPKDASISSPKSPVSDVPVHSNEQQQAVDVTTSIRLDQVLDNQDSLAIPIDDNADSSVISGAQTTSDKYKQLSDYLKDEESTTVTENGHSLESLDKEEEKDEVQEASSIYSPENPEMRVREHVSDANVDLSIRSDSECVSSSIEHQTESDDHSPEANSKTNMEANDDLYISDVIKNGDEAAGLSDIMGVSFVIPLYEETDDHAEYITSDCYPEEFNEVSNQQVQSTIQVLDSQKSGGSNLNTDVSTTNEVVDFDSSQQVNVIEIEGMHFFVPSQFLENSTGGMDRKVTVIQSVASLPPNTPTSSSTTTSASCKMETSQTLVNLDMQTDELMPPRGELSEQESVGGNDSSMWANNFHDRDEDVSTSYDLLARESWEASDGSDVEGSDNNPPAESTMSKQSPEPVISPVVEKKKKEKITPVYKCWWCGESFNCPKERRVHQSTKHRKVGVGNNTNAKSKSKLSQVIEEKQKISNIKEESPEQNTPIVQSEPAQFPRVFVRAHETLTEPAKDKEEDFPPDPKVENEENEHTVLRYSCSRCDANFVSLKCLQRHIRTVHKDHKFKHRCGTCKETFLSDSLYHAHLKVHPLECIRCGKYFYRRQNLNLHIKRHLGIKPYKCAVCDKAFVTKQKLAEHTNCHTGNSPLKCSLCSETFRRYSNLIQHKNRYHLKLKKKIKDFICTCGEVFHSKKKLEWHKEIHDEKPKSCTFCSERFVHAASLTRHVRHAHDRRYVPKSGRENENVECPVCSCVYLKSSLQVHMRVHSGERPYPCHICAKGFTTKWNLQLHRWTHASRSAKPFKCSLCKSAFFRRTDYTSHMNSHRNERPYTCNYCGCQFIRKYNCLRHVREHEKRCRGAGN